MFVQIAKLMTQIIHPLLWPFGRVWCFIVCRNNNKLHKYCLYAKKIILLFTWINVYISFTTVCDKNMFGKGCAKRCGHCRNDTHCHHVNGSCLNGCEAGYKGNHCIDGIYLISKTSKTIKISILYNKYI